MPFLQKLNFKEVLPLLVGQLDSNQIKETAKKLAKLKSIFIISTDLSHFLNYEDAKKKDKETIKAIEELDEQKLQKIENSACGIYPLLIAIKLCKIKKWKPKLVEYKNSSNITGDKESVVGYSSFVF